MPASIIVALSFLVCALPCFIVAYAVGGGGIRKQKACTSHVTGTVVGMSNFSSNGIRLPKVEYTVPVSTTTSPVTHTAEIAVKSVSNQGSGTPVADATGSASSRLPSSMMLRKPAAIIGSALKPERR